MTGNRSENVEKFLRKSLESLRLDYVDLYLIHAPVGLIGKDDNDIFPLNADGSVVLDMTTDLVDIWKVMHVNLEN